MFFASQRYYIFVNHSLKEDLLINTTFDPCWFSLDNNFKIKKKIINTFGHAEAFNLALKRYPLHPSPAEMKFFLI